MRYFRNAGALSEKEHVIHMAHELYLTADKIEPDCLTCETTRGVMSKRARRRVVRPSVAEREIKRV